MSHQNTTPMEKRHLKKCLYCDTEFMGTAKAKYCPEDTKKYCRQKHQYEKKKGGGDTKVVADPPEEIIEPEVTQEQPEQLSDSKAQQLQELYDEGYTDEDIAGSFNDEPENAFVPAAPQNNLPVAHQDDVYEEDLDELLLKQYKMCNNYFKELLMRILDNYNGEVSKSGLKDLKADLQKLINNFGKIDLQNNCGDYLFSKEVHEIRSLISSLKDRSGGKYVDLYFGKGYAKWMRNIILDLDGYNEEADDLFYDERPFLEQYD